MVTTINCRLFKDGSFSMSDAGGPLILEGVFPETYPAEQRGAFLRQLIEAPGALQLLQLLKADLARIINELTAENGGGATGLSKTQAEAPDLFTRQQQIDHVLKKAGLA